MASYNLRSRTASARPPPADDDMRRALRGRPIPDGVSRNPHDGRTLADPDAPPPPSGSRPRSGGRGRGGDRYTGGSGGISAAGGIIGQEDEDAGLDPVSDNPGAVLRTHRGL